MPEITVVVPVYNGAKYLRTTLESILRQTFADFELLVINDGSTDGSAAIVRELGDARVRLIDQENRGLCASLNRGIAEARGRYVARTDQDDISLPDRLERQHTLMALHPEAVGVLAFYTKFGSKRQWSNREKLSAAGGRVRRYDPLGDGCLLASTMFLRTEVMREIGGFRQAYYPTDDWDLEIRMGQAGELLVLQEPVVSYRFHEGANTYAKFAEMQEKIRWTRDSYQRRRRGEPERAFAEFRASEPQDRWSRLQQRRRDAAKLAMRLAGQSYLDGRYVQVAGRLVTAAALAPDDIVRRLGRMARSVVRRQPNLARPA